MQVPLKEFRRSPSLRPRIQRTLPHLLQLHHNRKHRPPQTFQDHLVEEEAAEEGRGKVSEVAPGKAPLELRSRVRHGDSAATSLLKRKKRHQKLFH
ncbi:hypothetical protein TrVFT333_005207 [Trichoderma virens FT-333]|nr:hypothetical protein TrVFT333_005207 [Trichoderma virens FT-333]